MPKYEIPNAWANAQPISNQNEVLSWWEGLSESEKQYFDTSYLMERIREKPAESLRFYAEFIDPEDNPDVDGFWVAGLYEYMVNHELSLSLREFYVGGVCTHTDAARLAVQKGIIPADFVCPLGKKDCPMLRLLGIEPGKSLRLFMRLSEVLAD